MQSQTKQKEDTSPYSSKTAVRDRTESTGYPYSRTGAIAQYPKSNSTPVGYGPPANIMKGHAGQVSLGNLTPELISVASRALSQVVASSHLDRSSDSGRSNSMSGSMSVGYTHSPSLGQRGVSGSISQQRVNPSAMVSYPSPQMSSSQLQGRQMASSGAQSRAAYQSKTPSYRMPQSGSDRYSRSSMRDGSGHGGYSRM